MTVYTKQTMILQWNDGPINNAEYEQNKTAQIAYVGVEYVGFTWNTKTKMIVTCIMLVTTNIVSMLSW